MKNNHYFMIVANEQEGGYRQHSETQEARREVKENQTEQQEKAMGAKERAEKVNREVKNAQKQMQNIMANMQSVVAAVQAIRQQLQLSSASSGGGIPSVARDQKTVEALQKKLKKLRGEVGDLQQALQVEEERELKRQHPEWSAQQVASAAAGRVQAWLQELDGDGSLLP